MEAAALFALGLRLGVAVASLVVSDVFDGGDRARIGGEALAEAAARMGEVALAALEAPRSPEDRWPPRGHLRFPEGASG